MSEPMSEVKIGDVVSMIFAQPGNDTTHILVESIDGDRLSGYDLVFDFELKNIEMSKCWLASERELNGRVGTIRHPEGRSIREFADMRRAQRRGEKHAS